MRMVYRIMRRYFIWAVFVLPLLVGCGESDVMRNLRAADAVIEDDPYAAADTLSAVSKESMTADEKAYYALLYTQAQIKTWVRVDSDTLINVAYDYYRDRKDGDLGIRANFYKAKVAYNAGKLRDAMPHVLSAYETAKAQNNHYWIARTAELLSDIFYTSYKYPESEMYTQEVIVNYGLANRPINQRYAIVDLAAVKLNQNQYKTAVTILDSLYNVLNSENPVDSAILDYMRKPYIDAIIASGEYEELEKFNIVMDSSDITDAVISVYVAEIKQNYAKAENILNNALLTAESDREKAQVLFAEYEHLKQLEGDNRKAYLTDSLLRLQSKIAENLVRESVTLKKSDFYADRADKLRLEKERMVYLNIVIGVSILFIIIFIIIRHKLQIRYKRAELESTLVSLILAKKDLEESKEKNYRLNCQLKNKTTRLYEVENELINKSKTAYNNRLLIQNLYKERWGTINMLCKEYFEREKTDKANKIILANIDKELNKFKTGNFLKTIEEQVNIYLDNIMTHLRQECCFMKNEDYIFLCLIFAGFTSRTVCYILDFKYKFFYLKKERLKARIIASEAEHKQQFLNAMC